jgi:hypothetical protein
MKDKQKDNRKRSIYIIELRYPPLVNVFDKRGEILDKIYPNFKSKLEHWRVDNAQVIMSNSLNVTTKQIVVGHLRSSITYEDPNTLQEFIDDSNRFLKELKELFPELMGLTRFGFRVISIFNNDKFSSFQEISKKIQDKFLANPFPSKIKFKDITITLKGEQFSLSIGPIKKREDWVRLMFPNSIESIPDYGIGVDIDSYVNDIDCSTEKELKDAITKIQTLAFSIENDLLGIVFQ